MSSGGLRWFDGYDGQTVAVLDDFRAKQCPNFGFFLRLLDRYEIDVEFKGGFAKWVPRVIFITCPFNPDEAFSKRKQYYPEDLRQLHRRITKVIQFEEELTKTERAAFVSETLTFLALPVASGEATEEMEFSDEDGEQFNNDDFLD